MTEERIEGNSTRLAGRLQEGLGALTGDGKLQVDGVIKQARGAAVDGYGRAVDALESNVGRLPANIQPQAKQVVSFARDKPLATVGILAAVGFLLTRRR
jgi:uncharacterized protein YjbJ (UPF0337 family)